MPVCVPVKELKNTAEFTRTVEESGSPVIVTKNGRSVFVSMTPERYEALMLEASRAKLYQAVDRAEDDIAQGRTVSGHQLVGDLRARYGL